MSETHKYTSNPTFRQICFERNLVGMSLAVVMAAAYFTFILTVAFRPQALAVPIHAGSVVSWGVLVGVGLLCFGFLLTAIYVIFANTRLDRLTGQFKREVL